jgi:hypothetical protein
VGSIAFDGLNKVRYEVVSFFHIYVHSGKGLSDHVPQADEAVVGRYKPNYDYRNGAYDNPSPIHKLQPFEFYLLNIIAPAAKNSLEITAAYFWDLFDLRN